MTPDELRALAEALIRHADELDGQISDSEHGAFARIADYLRQCADAKPGAWLVTGGRLYEDVPCTSLEYAELRQRDRDDGSQIIQLYTHPAPAAPHPAVQAGWQLVPVEPTPEMLDEGCDVDARAEVIKKYAAMPVIRNPENYCSCGEMLAVQYRAMLAAAPAAPQADIGRLRECAQRLVDGARWGLAGALSPSSKAREIPSSAWSDVKARHLASLRDALAAPQAEPKREPNPDEVICPACTHQFRAIPENVQKQLWAKREPLSDDWIIDTANEINAGLPFDTDEQAELLQIARAVERAHGIGGSDEC